MWNRWTYHHGVGAVVDENHGDDGTSGGRVLRLCVDATAGCLGGEDQGHADECELFWSV